MANKFTYQLLRDSTTDAVIKLTGTFDGSGQEANNIRIQANTLANALDTSYANLLSSTSNTGALSYYNLQLTGLKYYVNMPTSNTGAAGTGMGSVEIFWNGGGSNAVNQYANSATIFHLNSSGEFGLGEQLPAIMNNSTGSPLGDIGVYTQGAQANCSYTLILTLRKDNAMYQRGQLNDPAAFNYGPNYSMRP
jgi:hypothetical protein